MNILKLIVLVAVLTCVEMASAQSDPCACLGLFPTIYSGRAIAYGNGQFVAVGLGGRIMTSTDGLEWTSQCSPTQDDFSSIAFGNGLFVAVSPTCGEFACSGTIITSVDGINWFLRPYEGSVWGLGAVAFGDGQFVGVCGDGSILTSTNGSDWVQRPNLNHAEGVESVAYGKGQFVAVSDGGGIFSSTNGINWTAQISGTTADIWRVAFGGGQFVALTFAYNGQGRSAILTSPDGVHWNQAWSSPSDQSYQLEIAAYGNGTWVALGDSWGPYDGSFSLRSIDGATWVQGGFQNGSPYAEAVTYGHGQFVAVGSSSWTSADGINWVAGPDTSGQPAGSPDTSGGYVSLGHGPLDEWTTTYQLSDTNLGLGLLAYGNGQFVALGEDVTETSADGQTWVWHQSGPGTDLNALAFGNGLFVAVAAGGTVSVSSDGLNWTSRQTQADNLFGVCYGNGLFVSVGEFNGAILISGDGLNWTQANSTATNWLDAVAYGNGQFVAVSAFGVVVTSTDGTNWISRQSGTSYYLDAIAFGNGRFVATDLYGQAVTSTDGVNWNSSNPGLDHFSDIGFGAGLFVAVCGIGDAVATSPDGVNWTQRQTPTPSAFRVVYGGGRFVVLSGGGSIITSTDGATWTLSQAPAPSGFGGVAYGTSQFVVVGDYGAVMTSTDGVNWTQRQAATQDSLGAVVFGNGEFMACSTSLGSPIISTSTNGVTWVSRQTPANRLSGIAYGNGQFVAMGWDNNFDGAIYTSPDGQTWTRQRSNQATYFSSIAYGNGRFVALGGGASRATSTNGVDWDVCTPGEIMELNCVAFGDGQFVAAGGRYIGDDGRSESALITSVDGHNWNLDQSATTNVLHSIAYGYGQFVALGDNDTLITSADGMNWMRRSFPVGSSPSAIAYGGGRFVTIGSGGVILTSGQAGPSSGPLGLWIDAGFTNAAPGFEIPFTVWHTADLSHTVWDFGDGTLVTNQTDIRHAWAAPGTYTVRFTAYNDDLPSGDTVSVAISISQPVHYVSIASTNPVPPFASWDTAAHSIQDAIEAGGTPGRLVLVTNGTYQAGRVAGASGPSRISLTNAAVVRSVNGPAATMIQGDPKGIRCAYVGSASVLSGFTLANGAALDSWPGGTGGGVLSDPFGVVTNCVLVGNVAYDGGGAYSSTLYNCALAGNSAQVEGGGSSQSTLYNCTLTNNSAQGDGGGAESSALYNCTLTGNSSWNYGGGADFSTLYNCTLIGNSAPASGCGGAASFCTMVNCVLAGNSAGQDGGGAFAGLLYNCTLSGNSAQCGGGGFYTDDGFTSYFGYPSGTLDNCIVFSNQAAWGEDNYIGGTLSYCCTTPMPTNGVGNITNAPLFVNLASANLRLQSNSPCINAGNNAYAPAGPDLDGNPRIVGGTVDIGAYEFQWPASTISYAWLQQHGLPTDGSADFADSDGDGMNNWQEWRTGTDPTNAASVLKMLLPVAANDSTGLSVSWQSVAGVNYFLQCTANLPFFTTIATDIPGQSGTTTYTDTNPVGPGPFFYRIGVGN